MAAYNYFVTLRNSKTLVSCKTPYGSYKNMWLDKITPVQDEDTRVMSTFTITLKQIRFIQGSTTSFDPNLYQSRNSDQQAPVAKTNAQGVQVGTLPPVPTFTTTLNNDISPNGKPALTPTGIGLAFPASGYYNAVKSGVQ